MTRKDYVMIADALKSEIEYEKQFCKDEGIDENDPRHDEQMAIRQTLINVSETLADTLARDNAKFDRDRFLKAAGARS